MRKASATATVSGRTVLDPSALICPASCGLSFRHATTNASAVTPAMTLTRPMKWNRFAATMAGEHTARPSPARVNHATTVRQRGRPPASSPSISETVSATSTSGRGTGGISIRLTSDFRRPMAKIIRVSSFVPWFERLTSRRGLMADFSSRARGTCGEVALQAGGAILTARGESPGEHRDRRGAPMARRDD